MVGTGSIYTLSAWGLPRLSFFCCYLLSDVFNSRFEGCQYTLLAFSNWTLAFPGGLYFVFKSQRTVSPLLRTHKKRKLLGEVYLPSSLRVLSYRIRHRESWIEVVEWSVNFVLETLEDQLSLLVLVLTDSLLSIDCIFFVVEHVTAEIQYRSSVHFGSFALYINPQIHSRLVLS